MVHIQTNVVFEHLEELPKNTSIVVQQGGSRCFVGSTYVNTPKGYEQKRYINKGDKVYSYDEYRKCMTTNKVINKFIYEAEQPLFSLKLKNDNIICTPKHRFLFRGEWITAFDIARRRMERGTEYERKVFNKQFREVDGYKLQKNWKTKNNETSSNKEMQETQQKPLFKNYVINKWKIQNTIHSQISSKSIYSKSSEQTSSKPYKRKTLGQQSRKLRMGNTFRKLFTFFQNRFTSTKKKRTKWNDQINNSTSKRNSKKIHSFKDYCKDVSKRVWGLFMYNKNNIGAEWKEKPMARGHFRYKNQNFKEIKLEDIEKIDLYMSKEKVYDLEVENTHSYCITC